MPTYVYKFVDTGETIEVTQAFTDPTLTRLKHPSDGRMRKVKKVFTPVGVTFKGSGFYKTDSRGGSSSSSTAKSSDSSSSSSSDSSTSNGSASSTSSSTSSDSAAKTEKKSESKASSSTSTSTAS